MSSKQQNNPAPPKNAIFFDELLNKKYSIIGQLKGSCLCIKEAFTMYAEKLYDLSKVHEYLAQQISKYYNKDCVYKFAIDKWCGIELEMFNQYSANAKRIIEQNKHEISKMGDIYKDVDNIEKQFLVKKKKYLHYTTKLAKLNKEKQDAAANKKNYTNNAMTKLLRNEKKHEFSKIDVEKEQDSIDQKLDNIMLARFKTMNNV